MTDALPGIGWVGLGKMGTPICRRLKSAGYEVTAYVRNAAGRCRAAKMGLATADSFAEIAEAAKIVFSAVSDDQALLEIVTGNKGLSSCLRYGHTFVDTSTVSPAASEEVADALAARGVCYIRAPLSGSTATAEAGKLTVILSGAARDCANVQPIFEVFSTKQVNVGRYEEARYMKLAVNSVVGATAALVAEAIAFGVKGGLDVKSMLEVMNVSSVASPLIRNKTGKLIDGDYSPAFTVIQAMKDLDLMLAVGKDDHCPLPIAAQIRQQFEMAYAAGEGESDFFVLTRQALALAGIKSEA